MNTEDNQTWWGNSNITIYNNNDEPENGAENFFKTILKIIVKELIVLNIKNIDKALKWIIELFF